MRPSCVKCCEARGGDGRSANFLVLSLPTKSFLFFLYKVRGGQSRGAGGDLWGRLGDPPEQRAARGHSEIPASPMSHFPPLRGRRTSPTPCPCPPSRRRHRTRPQQPQLRPVGTAACLESPWSPVVVPWSVPRSVPATCRAGKSSFHGRPDDSDSPQSVGGLMTGSSSGGGGGGRQSRAAAAR